MKFLLKLKSFTEYLKATRILNKKFLQDEDSWAELDAAFTSELPTEKGLLIDRQDDKTSLNCVDISNYNMKGVMEISLTELPVFDVMPWKPEHMDEAEYEKILNTPIEDLKISERAFNCLRAAKMVTVKDLILYTAKDLMRFRNFGKLCLSQVEQVLAERGVSLAKPVK